MIWFKIGDRVSHQRFGIGEIIKIGPGADPYYKIAFNDGFDRWFSQDELKYSESTGTPTVQEIVAAYLRMNGYDGLFNEWSQCACKPDEFMPCDGQVDQCKPGYEVICNGCDLDDEPHFHIMAKKPTDQEKCQSCNLLMNAKLKRESKNNEQNKRDY